VSGDCWYLREDVYFEPLFNRWYAWPYLIPPVTAARHTVNTHKRIMQSFVNNHQLHILASQERGLEGGDYLNCSEAQLPHIRELVDNIDETCGELITLCEAVSELDELLRQHDDGGSLVPLYKEVPSALRGFVELYFDLEHRPSYRLLEPLLYASKYYDRSLQSLSFGLMSRVTERPFVFSTPRLPDDNHVHMPLDFAHPTVDTLFRAREAPLSSEELDALESDIDCTGGLSLRELFTQAEPRLTYRPPEGDVRLTYTGHAGFLIEAKDVAILIDPVIASRDVAGGEDILSFSELPAKLDYICLTHNHQDHVNLETLLQLRYKTDLVLVPKNNGGTLADPSIRQLLRQLRFRCTEVDDLDEIEVPGGRICAIPFLGEHGDLNIRSKTAWFIELLGRRYFFGADSSNPEDELYRRIARRYGKLDVLAIGMECVGAPYTWIYGALHSRVVSKAIKNSRRLNGSDSAQALRMLQALGAKRVLIYALGKEQCYKYFMGLAYDDNSRQMVEAGRMVEACEAQGIPAESLCGRRTLDFSGW
jgi:L-ascorbate metabolism protein UlaG (beta-lactamase superfamily)